MAFQSKGHIIQQALKGDAPSSQVRRRMTRRSFLIASETMTTITVCVTVSQHPDLSSFRQRTTCFSRSMRDALSSPQPRNQLAEDGRIDCSHLHYQHLCLPSSHVCRCQGAAAGETLSDVNATMETIHGRMTAHCCLKTSLPSSVVLTCIGTEKHRM